MEPMTTPQLLTTEELLLQRAVKNNPDDPEAWFSLAKCLQAQHRFPEALATCRRSIDVAPSPRDREEILADVKKQFAVVWAELKKSADHAETEEFVMREVDWKIQSFGDRYLLLSELLDPIENEGAKGTDADASIVAAKQAVALMSQCRSNASNVCKHDAHLALARRLISAGRAGEALAKGRTAQKEFDSWMAETVIGNAYFALGDQEKAIQSYQKWLAARPEDWHPHYSLCLASLRAGLRRERYCQELWMKA